jgi:hypothetical protein
MDQGKILRDMLALPPEAQRQVADFVAFLQTRYKKIDSGNEPNQINLADEPFVGMWRDREDMQDSSAWVRGIREREWVKVS